MQPLLKESPEVSAPSGGRHLVFSLRDVVVEGGFEQLQGTAADLTTRLKGKKITVDDVFDVQRRLEEAYARAGYVLVRVIVPPQKVEDGGTLRFKIVDGHIEAIDANALPESLRSLVEGRVKGLVGRQGITLEEIERSIVLAGDIPGAKLNSALARGESEGGTRLILDGEHAPVSATLGTENKLPESVGRYHANASFAWNSPLGHGEQIYVSAGLGLARALPLRMAGAGILVPVGVSGWTINLEYTASRTRPSPTAGAPATAGTFNRLTMRTSFPLIRTRAETLNVTGALEAIQQSLFAREFDTDLNRDSYVVGRVGLNWQRLSPWGTPIQVGVQFSQGLGGREATDLVTTGIPLSRQGASPQFAKLASDVRMNQPLPQDFRLDLFGRLQTSFGRPVPLSEQFALDGAEGLSISSNGALSVDSGATMRGELVRPFQVSTSLWPLTIAPYLFAAHGFGRIAAPTALEKANISGTAFGAGMRVAAPQASGSPGWAASVEFGLLRSNVPGHRDSSRINITMSSQF